MDTVILYSYPVTSPRHIGSLVVSPFKAGTKTSTPRFSQAAVSTFQEPSNVPYLGNTLTGSMSPDRACRWCSAKKILHII